MQSWSIAGLWNQALLKPQREIKPRDYCYASELGNAYIDRFLKMNGLAYTNPPNERSLRKFTVGEIFEWILKFVLYSAGVLRVDQKKIDYEPFAGCVPVHGRLDFIAGGKPDFEKASKFIDFLVSIISKTEIEGMDGMDIPSFISKAAREINGYFRERYEGVELEELVLEAKSCSSMVFQARERSKKAARNHELQTFHYVSAPGMVIPGRIHYISKDDALVQDFNIYRTNEEIAAAYATDLREISGYYQANQRPPLEPEIIFDTDLCKFSKNWKVEYSAYLTMLYGYGTPEEYRTKYTKMVASFNRTMKRCINGDKMTDLNRTTIAEAKNLFPNWEELVYDAQVKGMVEEPEENE
jgi:hypothetical protein